MEDRVILLWGQNWHPGVIGIVASRLVEKTGRPVIVVSIDENGEGKGSGRSVQGFNLHECIASCADLLLRFGGHAMAAGLSVRAENLPALRRRMNDWAARECPVLYTPPLECDLSIRLDRVTVESAEPAAGLYDPELLAGQHFTFTNERIFVPGNYRSKEQQTVNSSARAYHGEYGPMPGGGAFLDTRSGLLYQTADGWKGTFAP